METSATAPLAFDLSETQFRRIGDVVHRVAGIHLGAEKKSLVRARIVKRLRALSIPTIAEYLEFLSGDDTGAELAEMVDVLTTNKTSFFRELEHFRLLQSTILPALTRAGESIRLWSAGCSTGEEPYTAAIVALDTLGAEASRLRILATDISARVLQHARVAEYDADLVAEVPLPLRSRYFESGAAVRGTPVGPFRVTPSVRGLVSFARLNLMSDWPMHGPFDVIFCRNVMIYFDKPTQEALVTRFATLLAPGGYLFVGHSESLTGMRHPLAYVQPATYRK